MVVTCLHLFNTTLLSAVLEPSFNVKQTRGSEGRYVLLQEREDLVFIDRGELTGGGNFWAHLSMYIQP